MLSSPLVTAIIATYNRRHYICDAIDSVLNQTYPNIELIIIDDGSTDGTGSLLRQRYGQRIHYIYQENKGRSEARNHGIRLATGKYIAFLDSDDIWKPNKLAQQLEFMQSNPQYGLTHTLIDNIRGNKDNFDVNYTEWTNICYQQAIKRGYDYLGMSRTCIMFWSTVLVHSAVAKSTGPLDSICETYEDWDWYLRASLVTMIGTLEQPLIWYRIHSQNSSTEQFHTGQIKMALKHLSQISSLPQPIQRKAQLNFYLQLATVAYQKKNKTECVRWLRKAAQIEPLSIFRYENLRFTLTAILPETLMRFLRSRSLAFK